jgi:geranylgeranyl diphosphate synthase type II
MGVRESLELKRQAVEAALVRLLADDGTRLAAAMRYAVLGAGKRFRPLLLLASGEALGGRTELLLPYACAVELVHNYSLVHDDLPCMDDDDFRRGRPSCHKEFGETTALLAGDALLSLAFQVMAEAPCGEADLPLKEKALQELGRAAGVAGLIGGQWLDLTLTADKADEKTLFRMMAGKTGSLIRAAARCGAILAGRLGRELEALTEYGERLGLAFQLRDDLEDSGRGGSPSGVDAVSALGAERAAALLEENVGLGLAALERAGVASEELRFLAESLRPGGVR